MNGKIDIYILLKVREIIRDCFVTGKWKESEDAAELLRLDDEDDDELFGDFEDLETGEKYTSKLEKSQESGKGIQVYRIIILLFLYLCKS